MTRGAARATAVALCVLALAGACRQFLNPLDPASEAYTGEPVFRDPPAKQAMPLVERWQLGAEHAPGQVLFLDIPNAEYREAGFFIEPRSPLPPEQLVLVLTFAAPLGKDATLRSVFFVGRRGAGGTVYEVIRPSGVDHAAGRVLFRFQAPGEPATVRFRATDQYGNTLGERTFGFLAGDVDGDGNVGAADIDLVELHDGKLAGGTVDRIRADVTADGQISSDDDGGLIATNVGTTLPGPMPLFGDPPPPVGSFTVTYDGNGADSGEPPPLALHPAGSTVTAAGPSTLALVGHSFVGWNTHTDGSGIGVVAGGTFEMPAASLVLYAQWSAEPTHTVTYDGNFHTGGTLPEDLNNYLVGSTITPHPRGDLIRLQDGISLRFAGWNQIGGGGGFREPGVGFPMPGADIILEAIWQVIGGLGPAGGLVFYDKGAVSDGWRYLEAGPADLSAGVEWGGGGIPTAATALVIGAGKLNTALIVGTLGPGPTHAAGLADQDTSGAFNDWFTPSANELQLMANNLAAAVPPMGGFADGDYWSSSEMNANDAYRRSFPGGGLLAGPKTLTVRLRAARAFRSVQPTYLLRYDANGATGGIVPQDPLYYEPAEPVTVRDNTGGLIRIGDVFAGWNTQADGMGTDRNPSDVVGMGGDNVVLYAKWQSDFAGGDGTIGSPLLVATPDHLNNVRNHPTAHFRQIANIDLGVAPWNSGAGWEPIVGPFTGVYDGDGYAITNLFMNRGTVGVGLFGVVGSAEIRNVTIENANVNNSNNNTGILVGSQPDGSMTIANVTVSGSVSGGGTTGNVGGIVGYGSNGTIEGSASFAGVTGTNRVGGLVGQLAGGMITASFATGVVTGTGTSMVGGLVGRNGGTIHDSYATGTVDAGALTDSGGLVGSNIGVIERSYAAGRVNGTGTAVGGFAGSNTGSINGAYYDRYTAGRNDGGKGDPRPTADMLQQSTFGGWDFGSMWTINSGASYPHLLWQGGVHIPLPATAFILKDAGPAGGPVFYDKGSYTDGWRYMEATAANLTWAVWSTTLSVTGATGAAIGDGLGNTLQIQGALGVQLDVAYQSALDHVENGFDDWFLPSLGELDEMDDKLHPVTDFGFDSAPYWSSTEVDAVLAQVWNFLSRDAADVQKDAATYRVRPARRF